MKAKTIVKKKVVTKKPVVKKYQDGGEKKKVAVRNEKFATKDIKYKNVPGSPGEREVSLTGSGKGEYGKGYKKTITKNSSDKNRPFILTVQKPDGTKKAFPITKAEADRQGKIAAKEAGYDTYKTGGVKKPVVKKYQDGGSKGKTTVKKDAWGRPEGSKWYGFDPNKKKFVTGPKTTENLRKTLTSKKGTIAVPDPESSRGGDSVRYQRGQARSLGIPYTKDYPPVKGFTDSYPGDKEVIKAAQKGKVRIYEEKKYGGVMKSATKKYKSGGVKKTSPKKK